MIRLIDNDIESKKAIETFIKKLIKQNTITFTTSGTTGVPKKITHSISTITKYVKPLNEDNVWGLTYDYTKIAGSQVILQAYKNNNLLVNLYKKPTDEIHSLIREYNITHLSGTPTFYRLNFKNEVFGFVKQITLGGEIVTKDTINLIKKVFPNANILNVYALTEFGSVLASSTHLFTLNKNNSKNVKIENNTIHVLFNNKWYDTGDIVNVEENGSFSIIGRQSSLINVGGQKVNPYIIENILNNIEGIKSSKVYSKKNSLTTNLIVADVILSKNIEIKTIKKQLKNTLKPYELPRIINVVEHLNLNSTGKISRTNE